MTSGPARTARFDNVAGIYRALEYVAFGRDLERARTGLLDRLAGCRSILVLGEGDGRCLEALVRIAPDAQIRCVDASRAMLVRASARLRLSAPNAHVSFEQGDARRVVWPAGGFDAVVTCFFLDCFQADEVEAMTRGLVHALRPGGRWLFADFAMPSRGRWIRWRARLQLAGLYAFFRAATGISARVLPPSEAILARAGLAVVAEEERRAGFIRTGPFQAPAPARR